MAVRIATSLGTFQIGAAYMEASIGGEKALPVSLHIVYCFQLKNSWASEVWNRISRLSESGQCRVGDGAVVWCRQAIVHRTPAWHGRFSMHRFDNIDETRLNVANGKRGGFATVVYSRYV